MPDSTYEKCHLYPACTYVECDCHFSSIMKAQREKAELRNLKDELNKLKKTKKSKPKIKKK